MTIEERLRTMLGDKDFLIASLATQLEEVQNKLKELDKKQDKKEKPVG